MTADLHESDLIDEVRQALDADARAVTPPPIDRVAFQSAVRSARRTRQVRFGASVVGIAATTAAVVGVSGIVLDSSDDDGAAPTGPPTVVIPATPNPPLLYALGGGLGVSYRNGSWAEVSSNTEGDHFPDAQDVYPGPDGWVVVGGESGMSRYDVQSHATSRDDLQVAPVTPPTRNPIDNVAISSDGMTGAWFELLPDETVQFTLYDFARDRVLATRDRPIDGVLDSIVAVEGDRAVVWVGDHAESWTPDGDITLDLGLAGFPGRGSMSHGILALPSQSDARTRVFDLNGAEPVELDPIPAVAGGLSPDATLFAGFGQAGLDGRDVGGDTSGAAVWSVETGQYSWLKGQPAQLGDIAWLDADTVALTGSDTVASTGDEFRDIYVCELSDFTCAKVIDDTVRGDQYPMLLGNVGF